jgi:biofilm PGA synthesis N-glycosyltransferase PgaC
MNNLEILSATTTESLVGIRRDLEYVLITPARNESEFIEHTIKSVIVQTRLPIKWVIVSDGSTDGTDDIVKTYADQYSWIEFIRMPERQERSFAGKVYAFNAGYEKVKDLDYDIIGSLDADITFGKDYFSFLLQKFAEHPNLGVGGTPFREGSHQYDYRFTSIDHVSGACQLFRRECFESIGGYTPIKNGGIDLVAVTTARMKGWTTKSFPDRICMHHRQIGTGKSNVLLSRFRFGKQDFYLGSHPLWEIFRSIYQLSNRPYILGGVCLFMGYLWAYFSGEEKRVSIELMQFRRKEQMERLQCFFKKLIGVPTCLANIRGTD